MGRASLAFDYTETELVSGQFVLRYLRSQGVPFPGEPARLTMAQDLVTEGQDIPAVPGLTIDHYVVSMTECGDEVQEPPFPTLDRGTIHLDRVGTTVGQPVVGDFSLVFVDGTNLNGTFSTSVATPGS
jgi:hypothetical protein